MSIETLLTLGLTAAILAAAFVLRLVILGSLRLGLRLAGRNASWTRPQVAGAGSASGAADGPAPIRRRRPLWRPGTTAALRGKAGAISAALRTKGTQATTGLRTKTQNPGAGPRSRIQGSGAGVALGAAGASLLAMAAAAWTATVRGADALERWADRTSESLQPAVRDVTSAARRSTKDIGKYLVAGIATVQHVVLLLGGWVRGLWADRTSPNEGLHRTRQEPKKVIDLDIDDDPLGSPSVSSRSRISV